jgi:hypothetical protein
MAPRAEPARYRLARQDLEPGAVDRDREGEDAFRIAAPREGCRQRDIAFVAVRCGRRELLAAGDDDTVLGLLDHVECDFLVLGCGPLLVLRLGAAAELAPAELVPQFAVAALALEICGRARQEPTDADMPARRRVDAGHLVTVFRAVLQIVDARQLGDHVLEGRMRRDVFDPRAVDPDFAAVSEALDVASAGHRAEHLALAA